MKFVMEYIATSLTADPTTRIQVVGNQLQGIEGLFNSRRDSAMRPQSCHGSIDLQYEQGDYGHELLWHGGQRL